MMVRSFSGDAQNKTPSLSNILINQEPAAHNLEIDLIQIVRFPFRTNLHQDDCRKGHLTSFCFQQGTFTIRTCLPKFNLVGMHSVDDPSLGPIKHL